MGHLVVIRACVLGLLLAAVNATLLEARPQEGGADTQKEVLVLNSARRDAQVSILAERELPRLLERGLDQSLDFYSEYIDLARFPEPGYQNAFRDFLRVKYRDQRFDLVIAVQDVASQFALEHRSELFGDTPLVLVTTTPPSTRAPNATGVVTGLDLASTVDFASQLQPDVRNLFVITGADTRDHVYERAAREQLARFEPRLTVTYLAGLATNDLEATLRTLPPQSAVYYLVVNRDGNGESFHPLEYLDRVTAASNRPVYCWVDSALGHGIVGGTLRVLTKQTDAVARVALRVLQGENAADIPISTDNLNGNRVDWRELRRWGISEARLPAGTGISFKELSMWDRYRVYILGATAVLLAQTMLIAGLLVQRQRRQQAEDQVRGSQAELRSSYDRIRDLGSRLLTAQDSERASIARELHDDISQQVALLSIDVELLASTMGDDKEHLAQETLDRARSIAKSVHDLSHRLHPAKLRLIGLVAGLQALQRELSRPGREITFTHDTIPPVIPQDLALCVYRVTQEALHNAIKYSQARRISLELGGSVSTLRLTIVDDGVGFDLTEAHDKGLGLISMRERLDAVDGTLSIRTLPGAGTRIEIQIPISSHLVDTATV
jgi:signal transduction histidine kinase